MFGLETGQVHLGKCVLKSLICFVEKSSELQTCYALAWEVESIKPYFLEGQKITVGQKKKCLIWFELIWRQNSLFYQFFQNWSHQHNKCSHLLFWLEIGSHIFYAWIISNLKCSNWRWISKLLSNFGFLFTFCYLEGANSIKTDLQICNLWTGQFVSYKSVNLFWFNLPKQNSKK